MEKLERYKSIVSPDYKSNYITTPSQGETLKTSCLSKAWPWSYPI